MTKATNGAVNGKGEGEAGADFLCILPSRSGMPLP